MSQMVSYLIFADGACSGNPGPGGWGAIVSSPDGWIEELGGGEKATTNNRMELMGLLAALKHIEKGKSSVRVLMDSVYVLRGSKEWIFGWKSRGFVTAEGKPVANRDIWEDLDLEINRVGRSRIEWGHVKGHAGIPGNDRVDAIAVAFSKGGLPDLFQGAASDYSVDLENYPTDIKIPELTYGEKKTPEKVWYLSYVNGKLEKHNTWPECEARTKGRPGAKFKKVTSQLEEDQVLKGWGLKG